MVSFQGVYEGNKKCSVTHEEGATLKTDAPKDIGGDASAFSPTDLVGVALGTCILTTMAMYGERHNVDMTGARFEVKKEMVKEPVRRIGILTVKITISSNQIPSEQRATFEKVAVTCPVHRSLHPDVKIPITFEYV